MDIVLKLRELRRLRGMSQKDAAKLSGIGEKTISSFETGERIPSMKLSQLHRLLSVYNISPEEFFGNKVEREVAPWEIGNNSQVWGDLTEQVEGLSSTTRDIVLERVRRIVAAAASNPFLSDHTPQHTFEADWQMLVSRN